MLLQYWKRNKRISNYVVFAKQVFDNGKYDLKLVLEYLQNIFALKVGNKGIGENVWESGEGGGVEKRGCRGENRCLELTVGHFVCKCLTLKICSLVLFRLENCIYTHAQGYHVEVYQFVALFGTIQQSALLQQKNFLIQLSK